MTLSPTASVSAAPLAAETLLASTTPAGGSPNHVSYGTDVSRDGRYVVYTSYATDIAPGLTSGWSDVYRKDLLTGVTDIVSVDRFGTAADSGSALPSVSADGRYVAFHSDASDLVAGDTNGQPDVFVRDMVSGVTRRASVSTVGLEGDSDSTTPSISDDGRYVAFNSNASLEPGDLSFVDVYVRDLVANTTRRVSRTPSRATQPDGSSFSPAISGNGRYVAFTSMATNLVPGDTNGVDDVFLADLSTGVVTRASVRDDGSQQAGFSATNGLRSLSADGRYLTFVSDDDGYVPGDGNGMTDVFVRDLVAGTTQRVTVSYAGGDTDLPPGFTSISRDGRYVAFSSDATNLVRRDTNGMTDVFVRDLATGVTTRASVSTRGAQGNGYSDWGTVADGGVVVAFNSAATNLGGTGTDPYGDPLTHVYARRIG